MFALWAPAKKLQRGGGGQSQQHPKSRSFFATFQTNIKVRLVREPKGILRYCAETHHMTSYLFLNGTLPPVGAHGCALDIDECVDEMVQESCRGCSNTPGDFACVGCGGGFTGVHCDEGRCYNYCRVSNKQ